jgi:phospholipase/lecithinase/hemolysin
MGRHRAATLTLFMLLGAGLSSAHASGFDSLYVFGDSLSDAGNVYIGSGGLIPAPPYVNGEFSNGPVAVQDLAAGLGLAPLKASLLGGTDYAYGGGETGVTSFNTALPVTDILGPTGQLAQYQATHPTADPNALYVIWIGSNDLADISASASPAQIPGDIATVVGNIDTTINTLAGEGAKNFLVLTVPNLGITPAAIAAGPLDQAGATALSQAFDSALVFGSGPIPSLSLLAAVDNINLNVLDTYSLLDTIVASPAKYGLTNVTQSCLVGSTVCANPNQYLFFDDQHPTAAGQALVAGAALALLEPTPEPSSITLVGAGLLGALLIIRRRSKTLAATVR